MVTNVVMPPLGEIMDEGMIVKWLKKEGDYVQRGEILMEVETDKTVLEVESFATGYLKKILVKEGETAPVGDTIAIISENDDD